MTKVTVQANRIRSESGERTVLGNILSNEGFYPIADLDGTDYVTKDNLNEVITPSVAPYIDFVNPGDNMPKSFSLPARFNDKFGIKFEILLPISGGAYFSDTNGATMTYQTLWVDNTYTTVNRVDIYGAPDENGKFADKFMFTVYAL
jgi:hypothetical protein